MHPLTELGITVSRFRRLVAGDGCFKRLPLDSAHNGVSDEIYLWRAVLDKALLDLTGNKLRHQSEVVEWLDLKSEDFITVCTNARLEPEFVYNAMWNISEFLLNTGEIDGRIRPN